MAVLSIRGEVQKVIDLTFSIGLTISDPMNRKVFDAMTREQRAEWIAHQLRECGYDTVPVGSAWGVLSNDWLPKG